MQLGHAVLVVVAVCIVAVVCMLLCCYLVEVLPVLRGVMVWLGLVLARCGSGLVWLCVDLVLGWFGSGLVRYENINASFGYPKFVL